MEPHTDPPELPATKRSEEEVGTTEVICTLIANELIKDGDTICVSTPGGGGYEGALKRNPELVQKDVQRGYYTMRQAQDLFGVVFTSAGVVDNNATQKLRGQ